MGSSTYLVYLALLAISAVSEARIVQNEPITDRIVQSIDENVISSNINNGNEDNPVELPLLIGSFNIQTLGNKKFSKPDIMMTIEKVIQRYDLILILELMTTKDHFLEKLLRDLNRFAEKGVVYNMTIGERHPDTKEYCAFIYRIGKLKVVRTESFNDPAKKFYREPFVVIFDSFTLRDMKQFGVIGLHVKPSQAVQEMNALAELYDFVKMKYKLEDVLLMGDFNADCSYVSEKQWENIRLWTRSEFKWPIGHEIDTTTNHKSCALDRFVYAGEKMNDGVIMSSAKVFNFKKEFGLTSQEVADVSDHWPIELKIRGKLSKTAEKYLTSDACFTIRDSRSPNISKEAIITAAHISQFLAIVSRDGIVLINETSHSEDMITALTGLQKTLKNVMTREQVAAIVYKTAEGGLDDRSSYADVTHNGFKIQVSITNKYCEILICRSSSVN